MKRLNILEYALIITTITGISGAFVFGCQERNVFGWKEAVFMDLETGYNGGSIAMGIILLYQLLVSC